MMMATSTFSILFVLAALLSAAAPAPAQATSRHMASTAGEDIAPKPASDQLKHYHYHLGRQPAASIDRHYDRHYIDHHVC